MTYFKDEEVVNWWEQEKNFRYTEPRRALDAIAKFPDGSYGELYMGVPDDKEDIITEENTINSIDFSLMELGEEDTYSTVKRSQIVALKRNQEADTGAILTCCVPTSVMDYVERMVDAGNRTFHIMVNIRCWNFTDPIGGSHLYVNEENWEPAELASIWASNDFFDQNVDYIVDDPNYDGSYVDNSDVNVNIYKMLSKIEGYFNTKSMCLTTVVN